MEDKTDDNLLNADLICYKKDDTIFFVNDKNLVLLNDFSDCIPYYDRDHGLHIKLYDKVTNKVNILHLGMNAVNNMMMGKWDELSKEEFKNLSDDEYDKFMNEFVEEKTIRVKNLIKRIFAKGFTIPSTVQSISIPYLIQGRDAVVQFYSGSGKTYAFLLSLAWHIDYKDPSLQFIIVTSSHEVAKQIYDEAKFLLSSEIKIELCIGRGVQNVVLGGFKGQSMSTSNMYNKPKTIREQMNDIKEAQILICTMGKLYEFLFNPKCKCIKLDYLKAICIDEFDVLIESNFDRSNKSSNILSTEQQIQLIIKELPKKKTQRLFFSATVSRDSLDIARKYFRQYDPFIKEPLLVILDPEKYTLDGIKQYYVIVDSFDTKKEVLKDIISQCRISQCIIFINRIETASKIKELLDSMPVSISSEILHSSLDNETRDNVQRGFKNGKFRYLIATNVISRGFDVQSVNLVINFDMPDDPKTYTHRIGRSGRYGRKGTAISFVFVNKANRINEMIRVDELNRSSKTNKLVVLSNDLQNLL